MPGHLIWRETILAFCYPSDSEIRAYAFDISLCLGSFPDCHTFVFDNMYDRQ